MVTTNTVAMAIGAAKTYKLKAVAKRDMDFMKQVLNKYDKDRNNQLDRMEVRGILRELNDGEEVDEELVNWVVEQADRDGSGTIGKNEIFTLIESWLVLGEEDDDGLVDKKDVDDAMRELAGSKSVKAHRPDKHQLELRLEEITAEEEARRQKASSSGAHGPSHSNQNAPSPVKERPASREKGVAFKLQDSIKTGPSAKKPPIAPQSSVSTVGTVGESRDDDHDEDSEEDLSPRAVALGMPQADYKFVRQIMLKYDFSDNGFMEIRECAHLLQDLNRGQPCSKEVIRSTFQKHDKDNDSRLSMPEVLDLIETWYAGQEVGMVEEVDYSRLTKCSIM